jgi:GntR family transcriptional regulator, arabinose operon transcriptional repressor
MAKEDKALKYKQLRDFILGVAKEQNWTAGQKLPTELALVRQSGFSRNTVRQAFADLQKEGRIYRRAGLGTFFAGNDGRPGQRNYLVGVMVSHSAYIYTDIIHAAERVLGPAGYHLLLASSSLIMTKDTHVRRKGVSWNPDGYLLELWNPEMHEAARDLVARGTPLVLMNWTSDDPRLSFVAPNDVAAGESAFRYLCARGHRRIAYIGIRDNEPSENRLLGLRRAAEADGQTIEPDLVKLGEGLTSAARRVPTPAAARELIAMGDARPTAILCFNDEEASQAYAAVREAGLSIPRDISVIGFDDSQMSRALHPPLTTFEHPKARIGEMAARILLDLIERSETSLPVQMLYSCRLIERGSVRNLLEESRAFGSIADGSLSRSSSA